MYQENSRSEISPLIPTMCGIYGKSNRVNSEQLLRDLCWQMRASANSQWSCFPMMLYWWLLTLHFATFFSVYVWVFLSILLWSCIFWSLDMAPSIIKLSFMSRPWANKPDQALFIGFSSSVNYFIWLHYSNTSKVTSIQAGCSLTCHLRNTPQRMFWKSLKPDGLPSSRFQNQPLWSTANALSKRSHTALMQDMWQIHFCSFKNSLILYNQYGYMYVYIYNLCL